MDYLANGTSESEPLPITKRREAFKLFDNRHRALRYNKGPKINGVKPRIYDVGETGDGRGLHIELLKKALENGSDLIITVTRWDERLPKDTRPLIETVTLHPPGPLPHQEVTWHITGGPDDNIEPMLMGVDRDDRYKRALELLNLIPE